MAKLEPDEVELREMGQTTLDWVAAYYESIRERALVRPATSATVRGLLDESLPREGCEFADLMQTVDGVIDRFSRHNGHPRFFAYVSSPGAAVATMASMIAATLNVNLTSWRSGPAAAEMELLTLRWIAEMLGYPASCAGLLVSGGSMANFAGLAAARAAKGSGTVYASEEAHFSIRRAAKLLG